MRPVRVPQVMDDADQHDGDGAIPIQRGRHGLVPQDLVGPPQIALGEGRPALPGAAHQGLHVREDDGVVLDVDHPARGGYRLRDRVDAPAEGIPGPMTRNCLTPASRTRYLTTRASSARRAWNIAGRAGASRSNCAPTARSAS